MTDSSHITLERPKRSESKVAEDDAMVTGRAAERAYLA